MPLTLTPVAASAAPAAKASPGISSSSLSIHRLGTSAKLSGPWTGNGELRPPDADSVAAVGKAVQNRSPYSQAKALRGTAPLSGVTPTQTLGVASATAGFQGLNHHDSRTADGGNQYSITPPDQALCAGDGQVFEAVNDALTVYSASTGAPQMDPVSLNQFFRGDHAIDRSVSPPVPGSHSIGDVSCVYDAGSDRFFFTVYDYPVDSAGNATGPSAIDIAVSPAGTSLGQWAIYSLDTTNDGLNGTPSHPNCPCFADYPHLGTDANGLYITTNEFPQFVDGYDGSNVYAIDKQALVAGSATLPAAMFNTARSDTLNGQAVDGFTIAPALSSGTNYAPNTMYFLSSDAVAGDTNVVSHQILLWKIANTSAIHTNASSLQLTHVTVSGANGYYPPPASDQKVGPTPLADCLNNTACSKLLLGKPDKFKETEYAFDSSDSRMFQSAYANGKVWGALGTAVDMNGVTKAGAAYYVVDPRAGTLVKQGTLGVPGENISYPTLGVTSTGHAVMALSLVGKDYFPSAGYVTLDDQPNTVASDVQVSGAGVGPDDEFGGYRGYAYNRPRWGDYGAASVVGGTVWIASEYIAQSCTLAQYEAAPFGTCGGTRTALVNWSTHVTNVTVG